MPGHQPPMPPPRTPTPHAPACLSWWMRGGETEGKSACRFGTPDITTPGQGGFQDGSGESVRTLSCTLSRTATRTLSCPPPTWRLATDGPRRNAARNARPRSRSEGHLRRPGVKRRRCAAPALHGPQREPFPVHWRLDRLRAQPLAQGTSPRLCRSPGYGPQRRRLIGHDIGRQQHPLRLRYRDPPPRPRSLTRWAGPARRCRGRRPAPPVPAADPPTSPVIGPVICGRSA
jgi:hypothetical protein